MDKTSEEQFDDLAQEMIEKATSIECPIEDYIFGLEHLADKIEGLLDAARADLERQ